MPINENVTISIAESTGQSFEQVQEDIDRDCYTSPVDALKYGRIDSIITQVSIIPLLCPFQNRSNLHLVMMHYQKYHKSLHPGFLNRHSTMMSMNIKPLLGPIRVFV
ncbi:hypothetical protein CTI12_AA046680 [Artemisia annua]|uniref:ATP-dependent Clp protease proteolytic subunit n=1 Tax=Artemisia annua TaxID=35608 RepID=A0A2U1QBY5_ARTAN|nr:hypothetical protein CTI12_AA046680 [Artemisia annua]